MARFGKSSTAPAHVRVRYSGETSSTVTYHHCVCLVTVCLERFSKQATAKLKTGMTRFGKSSTAPAHVRVRYSRETSSAVTYHVGHLTLEIENYLES